MLWVLLGFAYAVFMVLVWSCLYVASKADERMEEMRRD